jgi:selenophosphate synthase
MKRNIEYVEPYIEWKASAEEYRELFCDPQTSGGLLVAVPHARLANYLSRVEDATEIGEVIERENIAIVVD